MEGFTKQHGVKRLVSAEAHDEINAARTRERTLKRWERVWKLALIERDNPERLDLYETL